MYAIKVDSEIKKLKKVLLHRPGKELLNLTPDTLSELLFDDIPYLPVAQKEQLTAQPTWELTQAVRLALLSNLLL